MSLYQFDLAAPGDDAQLRAVLAETPMDGRIAVSFRREPSYFDAAAVHGPFCQTIVCRHEPSGEIIGFGVRSVREMYVNGRPQAIGYLSALRVRPAHRSLGLVARGYGYFRQQHADGRAPLYLTTIAEGNERAIAILTSGRAGLPAYHPAGRYITAALPAVAATNGYGRSSGLEVRPLEREELPELLEFLNREGPRRQFFPCYADGDFFAAGASFRQLATSDVLTAWRGGRMVGSLAVWDQSAFRQSVVERYSPGLRFARPAYNAWAALRGRPQLPDAGRSFRYRHAALPVVADDDLQVFDALLHRALSHAASNGPAHLMVGLHEQDPLAAVLARYRGHEYVTRLYYVCWQDGEALRESLDGRVPYLELGTL